MKARAVAFQFLTMLVGMIKGLLSLKLIVSLGHENYAMISQFMVVAMFSAQVINLNYGASYVAAGKESLIAFNAVLHLSLFNSLLLIGACWVESDLVAEIIWGTEKYNRNSVLLACYILTLSINLLTLISFQAKKHFGYYALFQVCQQMMQLGAVAIGVFLSDVQALFILLICGEFVLWLVFHNFHMSPTFSIEQIVKSLLWLRKNSFVAMSLSFGFLMIWILNNAGRLILVHCGGLILLAPYAATFSISILSGSLINPVCSVFLPYFVNGQPEKLEVARAVSNGQLTLLIFGGVSGLFLITTSKHLIDLFASPSFYAGPLFVFYICLAQLFYGQARLITLLLAVNHRAMYTTLALMAGAMLLLILGVKLVLFWHIEGISFAFMMGCLLSSFVLWFGIPAEIKKFNLYISKFTVPLCWLCTILLMFFAAIYQTQTAWRALLQFFALLIVYLVFLWVLLQREPIMNEVKLKIYSLHRMKHV